MNKLILVADDAGFESVDRGVRELVHRTEKPVSAEYMIEQPGAVTRARAMTSERMVSIGIHFEISGMSDAERCQLAKRLWEERREYLADQKDLVAAFIRDTRRQLHIFRQELAIEPAHISTHGNPNVRGNELTEWWRDLMAELFNGNVPPMQLDTTHVRHNLYSWNKPGTARSPMEPDEFARRLDDVRDEPLVEFVMHPAAHCDGDAPINMLFDEHMRRRDLDSAVRIINSGVIEERGFTIVPVSDVSRA